MNKTISVLAATPVVHVGDVAANVNEINKTIQDLHYHEPQIMVFPELSLTGYTCGDLFGQSKLINDAASQLEHINPLAKRNYTIVVVGLPLFVNGSLYNCAAVLKKEVLSVNDAYTKVLGIVPKQHLPNYKEFYEQRWFSLPGKISTEISLPFQDHIPFGTNLLFKINRDCIFGIEICEDLWVPIPPSSLQALGGANLLINLSASNELVAKSEYRRDLVRNQSARCVAGYVYCSAGVTESTNDLVFGGHSIIAENGNILEESRKFSRDSQGISAIIDLEHLQFERSRTGSFTQNKELVPSVEFKIIDTEFDFARSPRSYSRYVNPHPFVPSSKNQRNERCEEIFSIQSAGLAKCIESANIKNIHIGISGGLDSTLALLVAWRTFQQLGSLNENMTSKNIHGVTMPGFGTSGKTKANALKLMEHLEITQDTVDIKQLTFDTFKANNHKPFGIDLDGLTIESFEEKLRALPEHLRYDPVFENTQARIRTLILMNRGFVLGTGDLSELALGWCTYNGDHMSMYNVNCSVPKTLVKYIVSWYASTANDSLGKLLTSIVKTEISPELLPVGTSGRIQSTEDTIGPYELHDFFLYNFVRMGFSPKKILFLANHAVFDRKYTSNEIEHWLKEFLKRFFTNQFKRNCVPNGPKVGSVSLSPRGDWRMPSDASFNSWLDFSLES